MPGTIPSTSVRWMLASLLSLGPTAANAQNNPGVQSAKNGDPLASAYNDAGAAARAGAAKPMGMKPHFAYDCSNGACAHPDKHPAAAACNSALASIFSKAVGETPIMDVLDDWTHSTNQEKIEVREIVRRQLIEAGFGMLESYQASEVWLNYDSTFSASNSLSVFSAKRGPGGMIPGFSAYVQRDGSINLIWIEGGEAAEALLNEIESKKAAPRNDEVVQLLDQILPNEFYPEDIADAAITGQGLEIKLKTGGNIVTKLRLARADKKLIVAGQEEQVDGQWISHRSQGLPLCQKTARDFSSLEKEAKKDAARK